MLTLTDATNRLYRAFSTVPKPRHIDGCPCCLDKQDIRDLLEKPLRELTGSDLSSYASSAFLTVGDAADYKYFLPRILEISATDSSWWPDVAVTGRAIRSADPDTWTAGQRQALGDFLESVIGTAIESGRYSEIDDWLCGIAWMGLDVRPFLGQVAKCPAAVLDYFESNADTLPQRKLSNAFWELPNPGHDAIVNWFDSDEIVLMLCEAGRTDHF